MSISGTFRKSVNLTVPAGEDVTEMGAAGGHSRCRYWLFIRQEAREPGRATLHFHG